MRFACLFVIACGSSTPVAVPPAAPIVASHDAGPTTAPVVARCDVPTVAAPAWAGWRTSGAEDPCVRLSRCAQHGCPTASCLHQHYGCLDSGQAAFDAEQRFGAAYFVTVACCP